MGEFVIYFSGGNTIQRIKSGKYVQKWIALRLYPGKSDEVAVSTFHNKLHGKNGRRFTEAELIEIDKILDRED